MSDAVFTIHLEGLDLAGKSSAGRGLLAALGPGWRVRRNSLCDRNPIYDLADQLRKEDRYRADTLGQLYVAAVMADLEGYRPAEENTIQDSTILLRSLAHHTVADNFHVVQSLTDILPHHPRFTRSIVLTASKEARLARLEQRQREQPEEVAQDDLLIVRRPDRFFAMENVLIALARQHFHAEVIDTNSMSTAAVVETIVGKVMSMANGE